MRKASSVLGIVGGALSLLMALLCVIGGILLMTMDSGSLRSLFFSMSERMDFGPRFLLDWSAYIGGIVLIVFGVIKAACGVLGLVGGLKVKTNNITAGVLMIVAAGVSLLLTAGWLATILLTLGGIFALVKEKPVAPPLPSPPMQ